MSAQSDSATILHVESSGMQALTGSGPEVLIRKSGNLIEISPVNAQISRALEPEFTYWYVISLRGREAFNPMTGERQATRRELRRLFTYDRHNRLIAPVGLLSRAKAALDRMGYRIHIVSVDPPPNPAAFVENWDNVFQHIDLRHGQDEVLIAIAAHDRGVIKCPPGFGKSLLISAVGLLYPKARIYVTTRRADVVGRLFTEMHRYLPSVGQIGGGKNLAGRRVTIFTADSLHKCDGNCDILIGDESHELGAPSYASELARICPPKVIGLSASPDGRFDGRDLEVEAYFGPLIYEMPYQEAQQHQIVLPIRVHWKDVIMDENPCSGMHDTAKKRNGIWRNAYRNELIAAAAREFGDGQCLILVETIEHALYLRQYLPEFQLVYANLKPEDRIYYVRHGLMAENEEVINRPRREQLRKDFESGKLRRAIATGVWNTGVSFEQLEVLIRGDASSSEILDTQIPGRVSRICKETGKQFGVVVDFRDQFDHGFRSKARLRCRHYQQHGWEQIFPYDTPDPFQRQRRRRG